MSGTVIRFTKGGGVRAIYHDSYKFGAVPRRASRVEPIQSGSQAGRWFVDMSPLGARFQYCLLQTHEARQEALAAEVKHIEEVWIYADRT